MTALEKLMGFPYLYYIVWQRLLALLAANRIQVNMQQKQQPLRGHLYVAASPRADVQMEWGWEVAEDHTAHVYVTVRPSDGIMQANISCMTTPVGDEWKITITGREGKNLFPHFARFLDGLWEGGVGEDQALRILGTFVDYFKGN